MPAVIIHPSDATKLALAEPASLRVCHRPVVHSMTRRGPGQLGRGICSATPLGQTPMILDSADGVRRTKRISRRVPVGPQWTVGTPAHRGRTLRISAGRRQRIALRPSLREGEDRQHHVPWRRVPSSRRHALARLPSPAARDGRTRGASRGRLFLRCRWSPARSATTEAGRDPERPGVPHRARCRVARTWHRRRASPGWRHRPGHGSNAHDEHIRDDAPAGKALTEGGERPLQLGSAEQNIARVAHAASKSAADR
jgi:hypothetical protein